MQRPPAMRRAVAASRRQQNSPVNDGDYRFCDLTALAVQTLEKCQAVQNAGTGMAIRREPKGSALSPV